MSWTKVILSSIVLALLFFLYFANLVGEHFTLWAIHSISPALQALRQGYGQGYSRALGHLVAFVAGALATTAFLMPVSWMMRTRLKLVVSSILIIAPVVLVMFSSTNASLFSIATLLQPIAGAALLLSITRGRMNPQTRLEIKR